MTAQTITLLLGARPIYRSFPGGAVMMPMERSERTALAETLRDTLRHLDDVTPRDDATESDPPSRSSGS